MLSILLVLFVAGCVGLMVVAWAVTRSVQWVRQTLTGGGNTPAVVAADPHLRCRNPGCRTGNPQHARFCRRCGTTFDLAAHRPGAAFGHRPADAVRRSAIAQTV